MDQEPLYKVDFPNMCRVFKKKSLENKISISLEQPKWNSDDGNLADKKIFQSLIEDSLKYIQKKVNYKIMKYIF